jgi:putative spermidine/putrescine transport system ATP-binding protein
MGYRNVLELGITGERDGRVMLEGPDFKLSGIRKLPLAGSRAAVAVRPEEMTIAGTADGDNVIAGRVDNVEYGGRDSLVDVVTAGGTRLHVRAGIHLQPGASVFVHVPPERVLVYPAEA